jgi:hypothetical protein
MGLPDRDANLINEEGSSIRGGSAFGLPDPTDLILLASLLR